MAGSNQLNFQYTAGVGLYALVLKPDFSEIYNVDTGLFETINPSNYASYAMELTEYASLAGDSYYYAVTVGEMSDSVTYPITICLYPASGIATSGDMAVGSGTLGPATADVVIDAIGSGGLEVTFVSPVTQQGRALQIVRGDDYYNADGRALEWTSTAWPDLTSAAVTLTLERITDHGNDLNAASGTVVTPTGTARVRFQLTNVQTAALDLGQNAYRFYVKATLASSGHVVTLVTGMVTVLGIYD